MVFIRDVEKPCSTTLSIYAQPKTRLGALNPRFRQPEVCLGSQVFKISMRPCEKKLKRIIIQDTETNNQYQVLVVYGTFVSSRVMTLLDNKLIYEGFITVYTRGKLIPVSFFFLKKKKFSNGILTFFLLIEVGTLVGRIISWSD
jgi:hypothetical protein